MTTNIDPNDIEDCQKQVFDLEAEVRELRAALENKTLDHASALSRQADLLRRAERAEAALERERAELTSACVSVSRMAARALAQELRANNLQAALERARE